MPIGNVEVPIVTCHMLIGHSTNADWHSLMLGSVFLFGLFWTLFWHFLGRDLYLEVFQTYIPNKIHFNLIIKSLKE